jgi:D-sedoheptulose 7-phosphate isomerase
MSSADTVRGADRLGRAETLRARIDESISIRQALLADRRLAAVVDAVVGAIVDSILEGGKVMLCGNGGSAADAQHLAAELVGRFCLEREPFPAIALADNIAALTAISNDYAYEDAYARAVRAFARPGDVLIGLSTSGESVNVVEALKAASALGVITVVFAGAPGSAVEAEAQYTLLVPAPSTASIQEVHKLLGHVIFEMVERELCAP